jgi:hypothetical protein
MPGRNDKERCGGRKETRGQRYPAMQFVHPAYPSRKTPHPEQEREERSQYDDRPQRHGPLSYLVGKKHIARGR